MLRFEELNMCIQASCMLYTFFFNFRNYPWAIVLFGLLFSNCNCPMILVCTTCARTLLIVPSCWRSLEASPRWELQCVTTGPDTHSLCCCGYRGTIVVIVENSWMLALVKILSQIWVKWCSSLDIHQHSIVYFLFLTVCCDFLSIKRHKGIAIKC